MARRIQPSDLVDSNRLVPGDLPIPVFRIDDRTVVKTNQECRLAEANAMRFIRENTSVPVPEVYDAYIDESMSRGIIVMEYIPGDVLRDVWDTLDPVKKEKIISQLRSFMEQIRAIKGSFIGSIDGSPCEDQIFCVKLGDFGPYKTEKDFHSDIIRAMKLEEDNTWVAHIAKMIEALPEHGEFVLTHSDFSPRNIIVRDDQIVAILDWEMTGFYPAYWEYIKAMYHPDWQSGWIKDGALEKILKPYYLESALYLHIHNIGCGTDCAAASSNAERFGRELLKSSNLDSQLPTVRFVFPTARKRRSTILKRVPINQWYDNYSLDDPGERTELQVEGLHETSEFLRGLVEREARLLGDGGYQKIVLGGLSQGCAASVFTLLGGGFGDHGYENLGGFIGMSGWLPFERQLREIAEPQPSDDDDPFSSGEPPNQTIDEDENKNIQALEALNHIRDILELPMLEYRKTDLEHLEAGLATSLSHTKPVSDHLSTHAFIGHGCIDPKVSVELGEGMADFLSATLRMNVTWKEYRELGHWYGVPDEINDIVLFLKEKVGIPTF
ncbi:hypothetical protein FQN49_005580 [Arthroderma sp. PD_2]|nr:hypothetical protein FQN49_005580 [Arthroderma sp. PD_2]